MSQQAATKPDRVDQDRKTATDAFAQWRAANTQACPTDRYKAMVRFMAPTWRTKTAR